MKPADNWIKYSARRLKHNLKCGFERGVKCVPEKVKPDCISCIDEDIKADKKGELKW